MVEHLSDSVLGTRMSLAIGQPLDDFIYTRKRMVKLYINVSRYENKFCNLQHQFKLNGVWSSTYLLYCSIGFNWRCKEAGRYVKTQFFKENCSLTNLKRSKKKILRVSNIRSELMKDLILKHIKVACKQYARVNCLYHIAHNIW